MHPDERCSTATPAQETVTNITNDIINILADVRGVTNSIGNKLVAKADDNSKNPQAEPCNLEQALVVARQIARDSLSKLEGIYSRL